MTQNFRMERCALLQSPHLREVDNKFQEFQTPDATLDEDKINRVQNKQK
jgi:hypothetical protein